MVAPHAQLGPTTTRPVSHVLRSRLPLNHACHASYFHLSVAKPESNHFSDLGGRHQAEPACSEQWPSLPRISTVVWTTSFSHVCFFSQPAHVAPAAANDPFQDLPKGGKVVRVQQLNLSNWCDTTRYDVELPDGNLESFFEKVVRVVFRNSGLQRSGTAWLTGTHITEGLWNRWRRHNPGPLALREQHLQVHPRVHTQTHRF